MENNQAQSPTPQNASPPQPVVPPSSPAVPPQQAGFSILEAIKIGWKLTLKNIGFLITVIIGAFIIGFVFTIGFVILFAIINALIDLKAFALPIGILVGLSMFFLQLTVILGYTRVSLRIIDNQKPEFADLFREYKKVLFYVMATTIYAFIVLGGLILLIIPGLILAIRLSFYSYLIVDRGANVTDSLKMSWAITKGHVLKLILFSFAAGLIYMIGYLAFGLGLIIATPVILIASAYVYRRLLLQTPGI